MDGVLTDFDRAYEELTGVDLRGQHLNSSSFWEPISKAGVPFWSDMHWKNDGKELWNYIKPYKPELLSAPSKEESSKIGKFVWVKRNLPGECEQVQRAPAPGCRHSFSPYSVYSTSAAHAKRSISGS
mgnify:CR=1 FL=1